MEDRIRGTERRPRAQFLHCVRRVQSGDRVKKGVMSGNPGQWCKPQRLGGVSFFRMEEDFWNWLQRSLFFV